MKAEGRRRKEEGGGQNSSPEAQDTPHTALRVPHSKLAFIALGSNLGDSVRLLREAMERLQAFSGEPVLRSSLWRTAPVDCPPGSPDFVNAVVGLAPLPAETPETLQAKLQALEQAFGRRPRRQVNEPRPLDLDLICFGGERRATPTLALPHPRAHRRRFVLEPLRELAPELILPGQVENVRQLLTRLPSADCRRL